jgi:hypothetical protein
MVVRESRNIYRRAAAVRLLSREVLAERVKRI